MASTKLSSDARGHLYQLGVSGWPSMSSLFAEGRVDTDVCAACGVATGTFYHRCRQCARTQWMRASRIGQEAGLTEPGAGSAEAERSSLFRCGIPTYTLPIPPPPPLTAKAEDNQGHPIEGVPPGFTSAGTDGSLIDTKPKAAARAGWAVVLRDEVGEPTVGAYGPCPDMCPSAPRAEAWAIFQAIRLAWYEADDKEPLRIITDCENLVKQFARGRKYCTEGRRPLADIWRRIFDAIDELQRSDSDLILIWVKGHTSATDVLRGVITGPDRNTNTRCDELAKKGALDAREAVPSGSLVFDHLRCVLFYRALAMLCGQSWATDIEGDRGRVPAQPAQGPRPILVHPQTPHEIWKRPDGSVSCPLCNKAGAGLQLRIFARSACKCLSSSSHGACLALIESRRLSLLLGRSVKVDTLPGTVAKSTIAAREAEALRLARKARVASLHSVSFPVLSVVDTRPAGKPDLGYSHIHLNKPSRALNGRRDVAGHPPLFRQLICDITIDDVERVGPRLTLLRDGQATYDITFPNVADAKHFIDCLLSIPGCAPCSVEPSVPEQLAGRVRPATDEPEGSLAKTHRAALAPVVAAAALAAAPAVVRPNHEPAGPAPKKPRTSLDDDSVTAMDHLPSDDEVLEAAAPVPSPSAAPVLTEAAASAPSAGPTGVGRDRSLGVAYDLLPPFQNWSDPMAWASDDPESRARRHFFDSEVVGPDGQWLDGQGPASAADIPRAWKRQRRDDEAAAPSSLVTTTTSDSAPAVLALVPTRTEELMLRQQQLDVVVPGARPSPRAAAAWLRSEFGAGWGNEFHHSHRLSLAVPLIFCRTCGHFVQSATYGRPGGLRAPCGGEPPPGSNYRLRLRRMDQGLLPMGDGAPLCPPVPLNSGRSRSRSPGSFAAQGVPSSSAQ